MSAPVVRDGGGPAGMDILKASAQVGAGTGVAGAAFGGIAGITRSATPTLFAIASGLQWAAMGATYWGTRQTILAYHVSRADHATMPITMMDLSPTQRSEASAIAGGVTGFMTAAITRGRSNIIPGTIIFSLTAFLAQSAYNALDKTHQERQNDNHQDTLLVRLAKSRFSPMKVLSNEEYEAMLREKQIRIEAEIALIDEDIAHLRQSQNVRLPEQTPKD